MRDSLWCLSPEWKTRTRTHPQMQCEPEVTPPLPCITSDVRSSQAHFIRNASRTNSTCTSQRSVSDSRRDASLMHPVSHKSRFYDRQCPQSTHFHTNYALASRTAL